MKTVMRARDFGHRRCHGPPFVVPTTVRVVVLLSLCSGRNSELEVSTSNMVLRRITLLGLEYSSLW